MSVEINWETLTEGPDGEALAEKIRDFVHERFQQISLPKLIRSVKVHAFDFGKIAPQIVLKDICEPLPDFYENEDSEDGDSNENSNATEDGADGRSRQLKAAEQLQAARDRMKDFRGSERKPQTVAFDRPSITPGLSRGTTPGFLHGTSNLGYFNLPLSAGLSGTTTPLAAVAGARFPHSTRTSVDIPYHRPSESFSSVSTPPAITPPDEGYFDQHRHSSVLLDDDDLDGAAPLKPTAEQDRSPEDLQVVYHVTYAGDVKLSMTAEVFLDYPMPSFVGIPLKLKITGMTFDGVGILAYIKRKAHLCFLAPEDAEALVGGESANLDSPDEAPKSGRGTSSTMPVSSAGKIHKVGGLIEDIRIESEMGETESGKQVLKNMGKIEKFILEQVQRIFEDEFVYPSFWTFLV